jgi:hypothetical protein
MMDLECNHSSLLRSSDTIARFHYLDVIYPWWSFWVASFLRHGFSLFRCPSKVISGDNSPAFLRLWVSEPAATDRTTPGFHVILNPSTEKVTTRGWSFRIWIAWTASIWNAFVKTAIQKAVQSRCVLMDRRSERPRRCKATKGMGVSVAFRFWVLTAKSAVGLLFQFNHVPSRWLTVFGLCGWTQQSKLPNASILHLSAFLIRFVSMRKWKEQLSDQGSASVLPFLGYDIFQVLVFDLAHRTKRVQSDTSKSAFVRESINVFVSLYGLSGLRRLTIVSPERNKPGNLRTNVNRQDQTRVMTATFLAHIKVETGFPNLGTAWTGHNHPLVCFL